MLGVDVVLRDNTNVGVGVGGGVMVRVVVGVEDGDGDNDVVGVNPLLVILADVSCVGELEFVEDGDTDGVRDVEALGVVETLGDEVFVVEWDSVVVGVVVLDPVNVTEGVFEVVADGVSVEVGLPDVVCVAEVVNVSVSDSLGLVVDVGETVQVKVAVAVFPVRV